MARLTKLQQRVMEMHPTLRPLDPRNLEWAKAKLFERYINANGGRMWCTECGKEWAGEPQVFDVKRTCPKCGAKATLRKSRQTASRSLSYYFTVLDTCKEWQVVRHYLITRTTKLGISAHYNYYEAVQTWIAGDGKVATLARPRRGLMGYYDAWIPSAPMAPRWRSSVRCDIYAIDAPIAPVARIAQRLKRNGYTRRCAGIAPDELMVALLTRSEVETMVKAKQYALASFFCNYADLGKYWPAIKIAIRRGYRVKDASLWRDYVSDCLRLGYDIRNSYYVCPRDLATAHARTTAIIERREEEARKKLQRAEDAKNNLEYQERWANLLSLRLQLGNIRARLLASVEEFYEEGKAMCHCVYTNHYYRNEDSVVFTVRDVDDHRLATVEYDIERSQVLQCRGKANAKPARYDDILAMFSANGPKISKMLNG